MSKRVNALKGFFIGLLYFMKAMYLYVEAVIAYIPVYLHIRYFRLLMWLLERLVKFDKPWRMVARHSVNVLDHEMAMAERFIQSGKNREMRCNRLQDDFKVKINHLGFDVNW